MTKMQQAHILFPFICFEWSCICHSTAVSLHYRTPNARNSNKTDRALKLQMMVLPFVLGSTLRLPLLPTPPYGESHHPSSTSVSHSTQAAFYTSAHQNQLLFAKWQKGSLDCMLVVQKHSGPPVLLVLFRKDLARMNGTPQPNQK